MTVVESVGWVLVHFVWQGIAIALALAAVLSLTSAAQATLRYALACGALLLMLLAAVATTGNVMTRDHGPGQPLLPWTSAGTAVADPNALQEGSRSTRAGSAFSTPRAPATNEPSGVLLAVRPIVEPAIPWLVTGWGFGVLLLSTRLFGGWWRTRRLRVEGIAPVPEWCHARLAAVADRWRIRRPVGIFSSARVPVPIVLGHLRPIILLPAAALAGLSVAQLEAIIAHELAHVRRHDYVVNLVQTVIETLLFYHPAVWWVSRQIRDAREQCCDDLAVTVCSSRKAYVHALLNLEELRKPAELLALGVTDGSLVARARRLLTQPDSGAARPRLAASVIALSVLAVAVAGASFAPDAAVTADTSMAEHTAAPPTGRPNVDQTPVIAEPTPEVHASSIVMAQDPTAPLAVRWSWAERAARDARKTRYWIGYSISPVQTLPSVVYIDRSTRIVGNDMSFSGPFLGSDARGFRFPGRRLAVPGSDRAVKLLFGFDASRGAPALIYIHGSTLLLPVDTKELPIFWLGSADAAGSQQQIDRIYGRAGTLDLQNDLIAAVGMHDASPAVVAWLERRVASGDADRLRAEAAEWIAWHPIARSVEALNRIAREDRVSRVRQEAAEALGDLQMPEAAPVLIALARELKDADARREAVEALGARPEPAVRDALGSIAREDPSLDIQREAVETLGDLSDNRGAPILIEIARTHPHVDVRREAIETLGDGEPTEAMVNLLKEFASADNDRAVQEEAIETLGGLDRADSLGTLIDLAKSHPRTNIRREAVEALADQASDHRDGQSTNNRATILAVLSTLAESDKEVEVQVKAAESLGRIPGADAVERLRDLIRTHPDERVRVEAVEALGDHGSSADVAPVLKNIALSEKSARVAGEAIETLGDLPDGGGITALADIAREHPDARMQRRALEALLDIDHPRARELFKLQKPGGEPMP